MSFYSVAIDGPSGAGKSTIAKNISSRLAFLYVDTGAIYRTVGLGAYLRNIASNDSTEVIKILPELRISIRYASDGLQHMYLNEQDVTYDIRTPVISKYASDVSAIPEVRQYLLQMQRKFAEENNVIMDGRDIGTVVLPNAGLKIFLTASLEARSYRRFLELKEKGIEQSLEEVKRDMEIRDRNDSSRAAAPLKPADDSVFLDTSELSFEESCEKVLNLIKQRFEI